jgi:hypothetical protein
MTPTTQTRLLHLIATAITTARAEGEREVERELRGILDEVRARGKVQ